MPADTDPRVYFAAERTLLAWVRTGVTMIGLGFLVARFGLFLRVIRQPAAEQPPSTFTPAFGSAIVLVGAVVIALAAWQHGRFCRDLPADQRPGRYWTSFGVAVAGLIAGTGLVLAVYLLVSAL